MSASGADEARAFALLQANRLEEAESAWRAILGENPEDPRAQHFRGCVLARAGRIEEGLLRAGLADAVPAEDRFRLKSDGSGAPEGHQKN
jgi:predicted Zn-dependent protease